MKEFQKLIEKAGFSTGSGMPLGGFYFFAKNKERDAAYVAVSLRRMAMHGWMSLDVMFGVKADAGKIADAEKIVRGAYNFTMFKTDEARGMKIWRIVCRKKEAEEAVEEDPAPAPKEKKSTKTKKSKQ